VTIIYDTPRDNLQRYSKVTLKSPYTPSWFKIENYAACKINVSTGGLVNIDYVSDTIPSQRVLVNTFEDFVYWMTLTKKHTFICNTDSEVDACIALCPDKEFKTAFHKTSSATYNGVRFYRAAHKLNITKDGVCYHILDVSDLSREGYKLKPLQDVNAILSFVINFLQICYDNGLVVDNNLTWNAVARNFLMTKVAHYAWPNWQNEIERYFQYEFYRWGKNSYHDFCTLGSYDGVNFDIVRSHLNALKNLPCHSKNHCEYVIGKKFFNPHASYGIYQIMLAQPAMPFVPFRPRMTGFSGTFFPDIEGDIGYMALQQELEVVMEVLGWKENKDFKVFNSIQVIPRDYSFAYLEAVKIVEKMLTKDKFGKENPLKSIYQRFAGTMFHLLEGEENDQNSFVVASSSHVFDPMIVATIWATERMKVWKTHMKSKRPHRTDMDGGDCEDPPVDGSLKLGSYGSRFNYSVKMHDDVDSTVVKDLVYSQRDRSHITLTKKKQFSFGDWSSNICDLSEVGKTRDVNINYYPGYGGRKMLAIPRIGIILDSPIEIPLLTPDDALAIKCQKDFFNTDEKDEE
jgi:hypothetical protein